MQLFHNFFKRKNISNQEKILKKYPKKQRIKNRRLLEDFNNGKILKIDEVN